MIVAFDGVANIDFDDLNWETRPYQQNTAYMQSKLANYLHALEASKRYPADKKLICASVHPGWVQSNLDVHMFKASFGDGLIGRTMSSAVRNLFLWKGDSMLSMVLRQLCIACWRMPTKWRAVPYTRNSEPTRTLIRKKVDGR